MDLSSANKRPDSRGGRKESFDNIMTTPSKKNTLRDLIGNVGLDDEDFVDYNELEMASQENPIVHYHKSKSLVVTTKTAEKYKPGYNKRVNEADNLKTINEIEETSIKESDLDSMLLENNDDRQC